MSRPNLSRSALANAFRACRLHAGMTQEDFIPVSGRTYVSELERATKTPTVMKLDSLAAKLGVHPLSVLLIAYLDEQPGLELDELLDELRDEVTSIRSQG